MDHRFAFGFQDGMGVKFIKRRHVCMSNTVRRGAVTAGRHSGSRLLRVAPHATHKVLYRSQMSGRSGLVERIFACRPLMLDTPDTSRRCSSRSNSTRCGAVC